MGEEVIIIIALAAQQVAQMKIIVSYQVLQVLDHDGVMRFSGIPKALFYSVIHET